MAAPLYGLTSRAYRLVRGAGDRLADTARANAWSAVCADRQHADDRSWIVPPRSERFGDTVPK